MPRQGLVARLWLCGCILLSADVFADEPLVEKYLTEGRLADGSREIQAHLLVNPHDDQARFGLGALQFVRSIEHFAQSLYQFGFAPKPFIIFGSPMTPLMDIPVPRNPHPDQVRYADVRRMFQSLLDDLKIAEATLAEVKDRQVKLPLHFGRIRFDLNADGKTDPDEVAWKIFSAMNPRVVTPDFPQEAEQFLICFDYGDVEWLRGYCHLLSAIAEMVLMYDHHEFFDVIAHRFFANANTSLEMEAFRKKADQLYWQFEISDLISYVHMLRFPLKEKERGAAVIDHIQAVLDHSRRSWAAIREETDNDHEWVPNPSQKSVFPRVVVTEAMIKSWLEIVDEAELILKGERLVPHWRLQQNRGFNLRKVLLEPRNLDLVLWATGPDVVPYLGDGPVTSTEKWNRLQSVFQGNFLLFAAWFN